MSTPPPFAATDITAYFSGLGGALEDRELNKGGDIGGNEIVSSLLYNFAPDANRDLIGPVGSPSGTWSLYFPFYLYNKHETQTVLNMSIWIYRAMSDPNLALAIGFDPAGKNGVAQTIPNQKTPPTGVTFTSPFTEMSTNVLQINTFAAGDKQCIWIRMFGNKGMASIAQASFGIKWSFERMADSPIGPG